MNCECSVAFPAPPLPPRASVVLTRKVMEMLGFKIVEVELAQETKADELVRQFHEVRLNTIHSSFLCGASILNF